MALFSRIRPHTSDVSPRRTSPNPEISPVASHLLKLSKAIAALESRCIGRGAARRGEARASHIPAEARRWRYDPPSRRWGVELFRDGVCWGWLCADAGGGLGAGFLTDGLIATYEPANMCVQNRLRRAWRGPEGRSGAPGASRLSICSGLGHSLTRRSNYTPPRICKRNA